MVQVADIMADVLQAITPYSLETLPGKAVRAKIDFKILEDARMRSHNLAEKAGSDIKTTCHGYPHYSYLDDEPAAKGAWIALDLRGNQVRSFVNYAFSSKVEVLTEGQSQKTRLFTANGAIDGFINCIDAYQYRFSVPAGQSNLAAVWLRDLSDGFIVFGEDYARRMPGPVAVVSSSTEQPVSGNGDAIDTNKPYFIGITAAEGDSLPAFSWVEKEPARLRRTPLNALHNQLGAKMAPLAGWEMPVWYSSVLEEHRTTRQAAGLFDLAHLGVWQVEGADAGIFLDSVCGNDILALAAGQSCYTHLLDPDANLIDDVMVYRITGDKYWLVVNAFNADKDWAWLNAVRLGKVLVDKKRPWAQSFGRAAVLRDLSDAQAGADMRLVIALQGPRSLEILLALGCDPATSRRISKLKRTELCHAVVGGFDLIASRTGYSGENTGFELFIHPNKAIELWKALLQAGLPFGLKPCGMAARDSLRIEAGLPLYGMEIGGNQNLGAAEAGFGSYVKVYKPWFVGRDAFIAREKSRKGAVVRFRFSEKSDQPAHQGDIVLNQTGRIIGTVTSCSTGSDGFLIGQAFVELKSCEEGTTILILAGAPKNSETAPVDLAIGDRVLLPALAVILSRFPKFT